MPKVLKFKPHVIFLWIGSNNINGMFDRYACLRQFKEYYNVFERENIKCFTLAFPNRYEGDSTYNWESSAINRTLRKFQKDNFVPLPPSAYIRRSYRRDGVHFRVHLYDHIARIMKEKIRSLF